MNNDKEIIEALLAGGVIGAALGAILLKNKEEGAVLGALAGAALIATFKANEKAMQTNVPMYVEEDGNLYVVQKGGQKRFIRKIEKPTRKLQRSFKLT